MSESIEKTQSSKKSSKMLPVIIGAVVLIGGGALVLFFLKPGQNDSPQVGQKLEQVSKEETKPSAQGTDENFSGKLKDALILGKSMKCQWNNDQGSSGVTYIKNNMVYAEMTINDQKVYVLSKDRCTYIWNDGQDKGSKFCAEPEEGEEEEMEMPEAFSWEVPGVSYQCTPTTVSDQRFSPPTTVDFLDPMELIGEMDLPEGLKIP
ncbi:hypothetical protein ACFL0Y_03090 [Patescibacteria group bacterium]